MDHAQIPGSSPGERRGLPIGNLTSQLWANVILDPLDHHMCDRLGLGSWTRYMDDMLVVVPAGAGAGCGKGALWGAAAEARRFLAQRLRLHLKEEVTCVAPVQEGIPWLGLRVYAGTARLKRTARRRLARRLRASVRRAALDAGADTAETPRASGVVGFGQLADSLELRRAVLQKLRWGC